MLKLDGLEKEIMFSNKNGEIINDCAVGIIYSENPVNCRVIMNHVIYKIVEAEAEIKNIKSEIIGAIDDYNYYKNGLHSCDRIGYVGLELIK
jgi:hypothetical protein